MGSYKIRLSKEASKKLRKLPTPAQSRIIKKIDLLKNDPLPEQSKKLNHRFTLYRLRVNAYRIIYTINNKELLILIVALGHRKEIYRPL